MSERREEIVAVAKGLFAQHGYATTSMRDIAEACDLLWYDISEIDEPLALAQDSATLANHSCHVTFRTGLALRGGGAAPDSVWPALVASCGSG